MTSARAKAASARVSLVHWGALGSQPLGQAWEHQAGRTVEGQGGGYWGRRMPEHPPGALTGCWGLGQGGCSTPSPCPGPAGAVLSPGQHRTSPSSHRTWSQAQPREPSCAVRGCRESRPGTVPAQSTPTRSLHGVAMGPGRRSSSGLYMGLTLLICVRLGWARALLHSPRRSCWTSPTGSSRMAGDLPGTPPPPALHLPQPPRDPSGAECETRSTGSCSDQVLARHLQTEGGRAGRSTGNRRGLFLEKCKINL